MSDPTQKEIKSLLKMLIIRFLSFPVILGLLILMPAGTFMYWQFYIYIIILAFPMLLVLIYFIRNDPRFIERYD